MTRIPYVRREELGPEGQQLWDGIVTSVGELVVTADGGLAGPFNAFVTAPGAGRRLSSLGAKLRFGTSIERRLSEIAIITTGARWQAEFEWWAHAPMAREHGVAGAVVDVAVAGTGSADRQRPGHRGACGQGRRGGGLRGPRRGRRRALPGGCGRVAGAGSRFGDRVHQLGGEPAGGDRDPGL